MLSLSVIIFVESFELFGTLGITHASRAMYEIIRKINSLDDNEKSRRAKMVKHLVG